ncbi:MAG TPA: peptide chain release factor N(5)-glutamine methyltransferase [Steroidobacteraceae bacterium]
MASSLSSGPSTTGALLDEGAARLADSGGHPRPEHHRLDAELLLAHLLGTSRTRLKSHPEEARTASDQQAYFALIARRAAGEPAAHLTGTKEFWSLRLAVGPTVLVPRPETELLVERALALRHEADGQVADLGTGSGAIALALASERPAWHIVATDISAAALGIARRNAAGVGVANVEFLEGSWFAPLAGHRFHLIASNPPYIAADDPVLASPPLTFEPRGALTSGADGLAALREIIRAAPTHLERGGWLLLEHGATQAAQVARELVVRGFTHVRSHRDLAGHERATEARF